MMSPLCRLGLIFGWWWWGFLYLPVTWGSLVAFSFWDPSSLEGSGLLSWSPGGSGGMGGQGGRG